MMKHILIFTLGLSLLIASNFNRGEMTVPLDNTHLKPYRQINLPANHAAAVGDLSFSDLIPNDELNQLQPPAKRPIDLNVYDVRGINLQTPSKILY